MGKRIAKKLKLPGLYDLPLWYEQVELLAKILSNFYWSNSGKLNFSERERMMVDDIREDLHDILKEKSRGVTSILPQISCNRCKCNYCTNAQFDKEPDKRR